MGPVQGGTVVHLEYVATEVAASASMAAAGIAVACYDSSGVTTPVGAPQPDAWVEVKDEKSGLMYYWNKQSGEADGG
jgi:hypothetical protein